MARKRKGQPIHGWIILDKPEGMTSTAAVGAVIANHLLSSADGLLSARVSRPAMIRVVSRPWGPRTGWAVSLRVEGLR